WRFPPGLAPGITRTMTILIVSPDGDAARSLSSALGRSGHASLWLESVDAARAQAGAEPPLVVVVDRALARFHDYIDHVSGEAPWIRVYEMSDAVEDAEGPGVLKKPFDA